MNASTLTAAIQAAADADHARAPRCTRCGQPGIPYAHRDVTFDGLTAFRGERLCPACSHARIAEEGINVLVIDMRRPQNRPFTWNSVRDADVAYPRIDFGDGRDLAGARRDRRRAELDRIAGGGDPRG